MTTVAYLAMMNNFSVPQPTLAEELKKVRASSIDLFKSFDDEMLFRNKICNNKYVDCAVAANADYIISNDQHFKVLEKIKFPKIICLKIHQVKKSMF